MLRNHRRSSKYQEEDTGNTPAWMITYGDMMTLLLVFFVLIYSFSVMDLEKFKGFISALQYQLGVLDGGKTITEESKVNKGLRGKDFNPTTENINKIMTELKKYIKEHGLEDKINMRLTRRGLVVRFTGEVLFDIGRAEIIPEGRKVLSEIVRNVKDVPNYIAVEGHTDNWPINNKKFPSNWELSTARAVNVIKYFIEEHNIDPRRLSAAGYSKYRPLYKNDSSFHRAKNRRVEVVILNLKSIDIQGRRQ